MTKWATCSTDVSADGDPQHPLVGLGKTGRTSPRPEVVFGLKPKEQNQKIGNVFNQHLIKLKCCHICVLNSCFFATGTFSSFCDVLKRFSHEKLYLRPGIILYYGIVL